MCMIAGMCPIVLVAIFALMAFSVIRRSVKIHKISERSQRMLRSLIPERTTADLSLTE